MPPVRAPIRVHSGSYEPQYWEVRNPDTGALLDLTQAGYSVAMVVEDRNGTELLTAAQLASSLRRTSTGRIYFEPSSAVTTAWAPMSADYQVELSHPSGQTVRIGYGPWSVDYEYIKS